MSPRRLLWPAAITLLAAFLRFHRLEDFRPNVDHAYPIAQAIGLLQGGRWPVLGQGTSVLFANPPGMSYLVVLPWLLFGTIWGVHYSVASLNLLVVPLIYRSLRGRLGEPQALAAALLAATNPWLVHYSRGTWVQGLLPLWATLTFVLLTGALWGPARRRARCLFGALLALTALTQMYLLAFLSTLQVGLIALLNRRRLRWRAALAGLAVFGLATGLYVYHLSADWRGVTARVGEFMNADAPLRVQAAALEHTLRYVTGRDYEMAWGNDGSAAWRLRRGLSLAVALALTAAVALGAARAVRRIVWRESDAPLWLACLLWLGVPIAAMTVTRQPVHIVYLVIGVPAGFVLVAPILARVPRRWALALAAALAVNSFWLLHGGGMASAARPAGDNLDTLSIRALIPFQREARRLADRHALSEIFAPLGSESLVGKVGRDLAAVSWFDLPKLQIFPLGRPAAYIRLSAAEPAPLPLAERAALLEYPGGDFVAFDVVPAFTREALSARPNRRVEWPTAEGLTLVGYDLWPAGGGLTVFWVVESLSELRQGWLYAPYAHLADARGETLANVSAPGLPGYLYRAGDVYRFELPLPELPAGDYQLELGLYDGLHGLGITFLPPGEAPRPFYAAGLTLP